MANPVARRTPGDTGARQNLMKELYMRLFQCLTLLCFAVMPVLGACNECTFSKDPYCGDDIAEEPDMNQPAAGQGAEVDACEAVPGGDGYCSDLRVADDAANVSTLISSGSFRGSSIDVRRLDGSTFDLVSIEYARANEYSERAVEACDNALSSQQEKGELRATRRFTALTGGAYLDEDVRRFGSEDRMRVRIVRGPSTLTPDTTCETCSAVGMDAALNVSLVETKFRGSATRDRILADGAEASGVIDAFILVEAVAYLPPPLPDQDVSVVDCEAAMHYQRRE